jgi:hypothetical protein
MNILRKKAAVQKYAPLHAEGKSEPDVIASILADEKAYSEEEAKEIYDAIVEPDTAEKRESLLPPAPSEKSSGEEKVKKTPAKQSKSTDEEEEDDEDPFLNRVYEVHTVEWPEDFTGMRDFASATKLKYRHDVKITDDEAAVLNRDCNMHNPIGYYRK